MPIDRILEKIDRDAETGASGVISGAEEEAAAIGHRYAEAASRLAESLEAEAERRAAEEKKKLLVSEELELRKKALEEKHRVLADVYAEARKRMEDLGEDDYLELLTRLVLARAATGSEEIVPAGGQRGLARRLAGRLEGEYPGGGRFSVAKEEGDFAWGIVLREGRRSVDLSLDSVFEEVVSRIEPEVSKALFPEEGR